LSNEEDIGGDDQPPAGDRFITVTEFAAFADYTPTYIRQLQREGSLPKGGRGMIPFIAGVRALIRFLRDSERRSSKSAADSRVRDARAREIEMRNLENEKRLVEIEDVNGLVDEMVGTFRSELAGLAARVTRDLTFRRTIDQVLNDILHRLADAFNEKARLLGASSGATDPVKGSDAGRVGDGEPHLSPNGSDPRPA
jgi:phage terminase Nu1 subunit (DNA packaging protein)